MRWCSASIYIYIHNWVGWAQTLQRNSNIHSKCCVWVYFDDCTKPCVTRLRGLNGDECFFYVSSLLAFWLWANLSRLLSLSFPLSPEAPPLTSAASVVIQYPGLTDRRIILVMARFVSTQSSRPLYMLRQVKSRQAKPRVIWSEFLFPVITCWSWSKSELS